jgi:uncharacterized protein
MMSRKIEKRLASELRAAGESQGDEMSLVGYAAKFNSQSEDLGGFRETIMPGAFARSLRGNPDVKFLMNHDPSMIMGRTKNGTLQLEEDAVGLKFNVKLPNTQQARDLYTLVKRGDIDQCSFAFTANSEDWTDERDENGDMYACRKLMDVDLLDTSAVTYPAYSSTEVNARFDEQALVEVRGKVKTIVEKRGSESQPPKNEPVDMNWPLTDMSDDWWNAFADAYDALMKKGGRGYAVKQALAKAIAAANIAVQPDTETPPVVNGQKKTDQTTVPHTVVPTTSQPSQDVDRAAKEEAEKRAAEEEEARKKKAADDEAAAKAKRDHVDDVSDPDSADYDPDDPDYDPDWEARKEGKDIPLDETNRDGGKTKKVAGQALTSDKFAWVGDPGDPSTWKLPVHDEGHARNALARFNQTKGIPADKKDGVWKKIVAACKKFGIKVTEEDSIRCGMSHEATSAIINELDQEVHAVIKQALKDRVRLIEIDLS